MDDFKLLVCFMAKVSASLQYLACVSQVQLRMKINPYMVPFSMVKMLTDSPWSKNSKAQGIAATSSLLVQSSTRSVP